MQILIQFLDKYDVLMNLLINLLGIVVGIIVAFAVHNLSKQRSFADRFSRRELIQKKVDELLYRIANGENSKVELVNVDKYYRYYPKDNTKNRNGYTYMGAELKNYYFEGVEFYCGNLSGYRLTDDEFGSKKLSPEHNQETIFSTGTIPYDWIESVDLKGDDTVNRPQFYSHFSGTNGDPYKKIRYYVKDSNNRLREIEYIA